MSEIKMKNPDLRKVSKISGYFFVPSYQRGYRWGRHEVEALLDDVYADGGRREDEKYCLQPVVVKEKVAGADDGEPMEGLPPVGEVYYELIDGQQRLTTLYLVYLYLKKIKNIEPSFSLAYQTRPGSTGYLRFPDEALRYDNIDFFHMYDAYQCIVEWFDKAAERTDDHQVMGVADDIYRYLRNQVHVIWYDAGKEDSITLFTRLNVGRIALTNAELVKALLLASKGEELTDKYRQIEIATQWDMIERELQNDAFWAFLTNRSSSDYPTRIELLFDLLAQKAENEKERFFTFLYFKDCLTEQEKVDALKKVVGDEKKGPLKVWEPVLELYHLLQEWFENRDQYHKVGYLVATGDKLGVLVEEATGDKAPTKSGFLTFLNNRITDRLNLDEMAARGLDYESKYKDCERLLLLFNIESVRLLEHSSERYPFDSHKKEHWSLEHIHAQNAEPLKTEDGWRFWLKDGMRALEALPRLDDETREVSKVALVDEIKKVLGPDWGRVERKDFDPLSRRIMIEFLNAEGTDAEKHSIANLALLSGEVNSTLSNGAFQVKRLRIIDLDQNGKFIPMCTRRAFLKYYTPAGSQQMHLWNKEDQESYLDAMLAEADSTLGRKEGVIRKYLKKPTREVLS
jgi:Protein of unknown function DUF262/Protein of unknown function (DUF1524)